MSVTSGFGGIHSPPTEAQFESKYADLMHVIIVCVRASLLVRSNRLAG